MARYDISNGGRTRRLERKFQKDLKNELERRFPGCVILKNDPTYEQGIPDLLVLHEDTWAALECKRSKDAHRQPNQEDWVDILNNMSYASFIYPENKDQVLNELDLYFGKAKAVKA